MPSLAAASDLMLYSPGLLLLLVTVEHKLDSGCARALPLMRTTVLFNISGVPTAQKLGIRTIIARLYDTPCTYDVILWRLHVTIVAVEQQ